MPVGEEEINEVVAQAIAELQANSPKDIGKDMKSVFRKFAGNRVDGTIANETVRSHLAGWYSNILLCVTLN